MPLNSASFETILAIDFDNANNMYLVNEGFNLSPSSTIRKISNGIVSTIAGTPGTYGFIDGVVLNAIA